MSDGTKAQDYNHTMNLPKTEFPMRAGLPAKEPEILAAWREMGLYERLMEKGRGKTPYILHAGPPYANGSMHIGHALNQTVKDFVVRYRNMAGYHAPFVPGWDCHGLPIELKAREKAGLGNAAAMPPVALRSICREFAEESVNRQREQAKRMGYLGDWDNPYLTYNPQFEARQLRLFAEMADGGYIYKGLKPVYWCPECRTALAEAEIEYAEDTCYSVYVAFGVKADDKGVLVAAGVPAEQVGRVSFVIWTTTTWTLPGNVAVCLGPDFTYAVVRAGARYFVMAEALHEAALAAAGIEEYEVAARLTGRELEGIRLAHPFLERESLVIVGDHVTLESGTGCVHTAPGHGVEDYEVCKNYPGLPMVVPVDAQGRMTAEAGAICAGMTVDEANKALAAHMAQTGALLASQKIEHQYPHCWRCHQPVLFRATEQWFCSVQPLLETAEEAVHAVKWTPAWGEERMAAMVRERSDWCISRQRLWGVPIPAFYCRDCGKPVLERGFIEATADLFEREGSDGWYTHEAADFLPEGAACPHCGGEAFDKETDTMDVWFDSGSSHAAVCEARDELCWPADLYLEGGDQYRGWFQSSLLTALAWRGVAPYKAVATNGWTVDGEGRQMHKSLGNGVEPQEVIDRYGADILRLWVASLDFKVDARVSEGILKQASESYRKLRNTARFLLGNLGDFDPERDAVLLDELTGIDRWALARLDEVIAAAKAGYEALEFHSALHGIHHFCVVDMSNFYLDVVKDRLYCEAADSGTRRQAQTAMYAILSALTRMLAPILAFTAEEIWSHMPHVAGEDTRSVALAAFPEAAGVEADGAFMAEWARVRAVREEVTKALELARADKLIGGSLEASVTLFASGEWYDFAAARTALLAEVCIVSALDVARGEGIEGGVGVRVARAAGEKCARCWQYHEDVGHDAAHPDLCGRCAGLM